jgi:hypothetical protein
MKYHACWHINYIQSSEQKSRELGKKHMRYQPQGRVRTPAYPYGALVLGPPNFGGLRPKCPIPFTEFKASRADMYAWPTKSCPSWSMSDPPFTENWRFDLSFGQIFRNISEGSLKLRPFDLQVIFRFGPLLCLKQAIRILERDFTSDTWDIKPYFSRKYFDYPNKR